jgi:hypothetical protein
MQKDFCEKLFSAFAAFKGTSMAAQKRPKT